MPNPRFTRGAFVNEAGTTRSEFLVLNLLIVGLAGGISYYYFPSAGRTVAMWVAAAMLAIVTIEVFGRVAPRVRKYNTRLVVLRSLSAEEWLLPDEVARRVRARNPFRTLDVDDVAEALWDLSDSDSISEKDGKFKLFDVSS
jgi:hypothetical protein